MSTQSEHRMDTHETMQASSGLRLETVCESLADEMRPALEMMGEHLAALREIPDSTAEADSGALIDRVGDTAARIEETLHALVDYVALARIPLIPARVNLSLVASNRVRRLRELEPSRSVDVIVHDGMFAVGDATLLAEVLDCLIDRAWRSTVETRGGWIEIGTRMTAQGRRQFYVSDNGLGLDAENEVERLSPDSGPRSLESFFGHGMGLARAIRIVGRHAGKLQADAATGMGAEFFFTLGSPLESGAALH